MSNPWAAEAILKIGPRAATDPLGAGSAIRRTTIGAASAPDDALNTPVGPLGCWVTYIADTDCYLHLGPSGVADIAASATVSMFLPAGTFFESWTIPRVNDRVVVIQKTAPGFLYHYQSNL